MDTPRDAYEEALQKMFDAANETMDVDDISTLNDFASKAMIRAAAEAIGLRQMMEVIEDVANGAGNVSNATIAKAARLLP
jgi:hypothetical protein